jgi:hypothetical protein
MRAIIAAVHGILTTQTDASWPDKLDAWMMRRDSGIKVIKKEYAAGPFPKWNCLVKDPKIARGLVEEIKLLIQPGTGRVNDMVSTPIWIVAHSNGAVIALKAAKLLIEDGYRVAGLILTGAACDADVDRSGVAGWLEAEELGTAVAFCSADDKVLKKVSNPWTRLLTWPYGDLGRRGWMRDGVRYDIYGTKTQWFDGGHSCYFRPSRINDTFERIYSIVRKRGIGTDTDGHGRTRTDTDQHGPAPAFAQGSGAARRAPGTDTLSGGVEALGKYFPKLGEVGRDALNQSGPNGARTNTDGHGKTNTCPPSPEAPARRTSCGGAQ